MSRNDLISVMEAELEKLNTHIDLCIIRGLSYRQEARRHRFLCKQLGRLRPVPVLSHSWLDSAAKLVSTFVF